MLGRARIGVSSRFVYATPTLKASSTQDGLTGCPYKIGHFPVKQGGSD